MEIMCVLESGLVDIIYMCAGKYIPKAKVEERAKKQ